MSGAPDIREIAREEAERAVDSHEDICAVRYASLDASLSSLWKVVAWGGTTAFGIVLALLAFFAKAQWDMVAELQKAAVQRAALSDQIHNAPPPQVVIQRAPGSPDIGASVERQPQAR